MKLFLCNMKSELLVDIYPYIILLSKLHIVDVDSNYNLFTRGGC
jgi:hypothetical protein